MKPIRKLSGEITVSGKNKLSMKLEHGEPKDVHVAFSEHKHASCNPHRDELFWRVEASPHGFALIIEWHVEDIRAIIYELLF